MNSNKEHEDIETAMIDRDMASPQFASYAARSEALRLMQLMRHLYPDTEMSYKAEEAYELICYIDRILE